MTDPNRKEKRMNYVVIDTETTGMDPESDRLVEIAAVRDEGSYSQSLVNPGDRPIGFDAMATHHITPEMVAGAPDPDQAIADLGLDDLPSDTVLVFHKADFDLPFLPAALRDQPSVCTYRCALHLVPDAESHANGALWYELGLDRPMPPETGQMPHRALFDALMTADLLRWMLDHVPLRGDVEEDRDGVEAMRELYRLSRQPVVLKTCRFGKHAGAPWADVPADYMGWVLKQDFDEDVKHTCRYWLDRRAGTPS